MPESMCSKPFGGVTVAVGNVEKLLDDADDFRYRGATGSSGVAVEPVLDRIELGELIAIR
jgi:hypothetical protein